MEFKKILLPDLGEGVTEGEILKIKVKEGDKISMDQPLLEVMTDKASIEVPSSIEGTIQKVEIKEGEMVSVGKPLFTISDSKTTQDLAGHPSHKEAKPTKATDFPEATSSPHQASSHKEDTSPEVAPLHKAINSATDFSQATGDSPHKVAPSLQATGDSPIQAEVSNAKPESKVLSLPATRKLAQELGIDLHSLSGDKGEVKRQDLIHHIKSQLSASGSANLNTNTLATNPAAVKNLQSPNKTTGENTLATQNLKPLTGQNPKAPLLDMSSNQEVKREPLRGIKRLMFESMALSKATIPHFTIGDQAKMDLIVKVREEMKQNLQKQGLKIGYLAFFIKALVPVLKEFPIFNSVYEAKNKEIVFLKHQNIGFAVDSPQGLLVPVLKQVENKSFLQIIKDINQLAQQTRQGQAGREQLTGASITLSNLGSLGAYYGTPIINPPEMAIMGIYSLFNKVFKNTEGDLTEGAFINFSITCDHRFIDGATATRFLKSFIRKIEEPSLLLLD